MKNANNKEIKIYIDNNDVEETYGEIINFNISQNGNYQDMYCIKSNLLTLTILTDELDLYDTSLKGLSVIVENVTDNIVMFRGVISQTPSALAYNYEKESFTLYAVDKLRYVLMNTEVTSMYLRDMCADMSFYDALSNFFGTYGYSLNSIPFYYYQGRYIPDDMYPDVSVSVNIDFLKTINLPRETIGGYRYYVDDTTRYEFFQCPELSLFLRDDENDILTWEGWLNMFCKMLSLLLKIEGDIATFSNPCTPNTSVNTTTAHYADTNKGLNDALANMYVKRTHIKYDVDDKWYGTSVEDCIPDDFFDGDLNSEVAWNFPLGVQLSAYDSSSIFPVAQRFGLTREPYSAWSGYTFKNKWGDGQDTSDYYSRYLPYLQHDDTGRWQGFTAELYVTYYKEGELAVPLGAEIYADPSTCKGILIARDVSTISMNDERVTDKRWSNGNWISIAEDSSNYPSLFRSAVLYDIDEWPVYDSSTMLPQKNLQYKKRLLVTPTQDKHLFVGYDNRTLGYKKALSDTSYYYAECNFTSHVDKLDREHNKYYLIAKLDLEMITNQNSGTINDMPQQTFWSNGNADLKYLSRKGASYDIVFNTNTSTHAYFDDEYIWKWEITDEPYMLCDIRIYLHNGYNSQLQRLELENQKIYIKCDNENILGELHEIDNTNWSQNLKTSGYIVYQFSDEQAARLSLYPYCSMDVKFKGVGNFGGRLFTNTVSFAEGQSGDVSTLLKGIKELSMLEYISYDNNPQYDPMFRSPSTFEGAEISIDKYLLNFSFEIQAGYDGTAPTQNTEYLAKEVTEIANVNGTGVGVLDTAQESMFILTFYYEHSWQWLLFDVEKYDDIDEKWEHITTAHVLWETPAYQIYNVNPFDYICVFDLVRLATYADQFTTPSIVLDLTMPSNDQFIDFESTRYRLVSYNYDGVRDIYKNKYILLKDLTSIQYDNTSTNI